MSPLLLLLPCLSLVSGSPPSPRLLSPQCGRHVALYVTSLARGDSWALHMMDASTKIPEGYFWGLFNYLGNYDECLAVRVDDLPEGPFQGQYCKVTVRLSPSPASTPLTRLLHNVTRQGREASATMMWASCLPSSCSPEDVATFLEDHYAPLLGINVDVIGYKEENCYVKAPAPPLGVGALSTLCLVALLAALVAVSSSLHLLGLLPTLSAVFAADVTAAQLFSTKRERGGFPCLHGLRVGSILWVILAHRIAQECWGPVSNQLLVFNSDMNHRPRDMTINNAALAVDTFFFLSGLLMCHSFLRGMQRGGNFDVIKFYLYRYLRLTIPMAAVILLYSTVIDLLGHGPLWDKYVTVEATNCRYNWWYDLLYINNYFSFEYKFCLAQTWYTAVDMQLSWLSPLVLLPLYFSPRAGKQLMAVLTLISCLIPLGITYVYGFPMSFVTLPPQPNVGAEGNFYLQLYIATQCRATPYLCGIMMGYILHKTGKTKVQISKPLVAFGWLISTSVCMTVVYSLAITYKVDYEYDRLGSAFYAGFHRLGWSAGLMWIIFACVNGYGGFIDSMLSWRVLLPLSRLTYGVYLLHMLVQTLDGGDDRTPRHFSSFESTYKFFGDAIISYIAAIALYLLVEGPVLSVLKIVFGKGDASKNLKVKSSAQNEETCGKEKHQR